MCVRRSSVDILNDDLKITTIYSVLSAYPWTHCRTVHINIDTCETESRISENQFLKWFKFYVGLNNVNIFSSIRLSLSIIDIK